MDEPTLQKIIDDVFSVLELAVGGNVFVKAALVEVNRLIDQYLPLILNKINAK